LCQILQLQTSKTQPLAYLNELVALDFALQIIDHDGQKSKPKNPQQVPENFENSPGLPHVDLRVVSGAS
jgi:hypothetical protein